jgi:hypothetical protein
MLARCARCQGTFTTDRYGRQTCPHCSAELILPDPTAPAGAPQGAEPPQPAPPPAAAPPPPPRAQEPPPGPPPGGYAAPPGGWPPPPPGPGWGGPPPPGGGWGGPPPPPGPGELPTPFAERKRLGFFAAFFETWKLVATQPQQFFARVRIDQTGSAILFGVIASTVGNLASSIYAYFSGQQAFVAMQQLMEGLPAGQREVIRAYAEATTGGAILAQVVLSPLLTVIFIYLGAGVLHLLLLLFRGANRGFDATLTTVAHASGLLLLLAVPGCGGLLAGIWALMSTIIGLGAIQRCGAGKAAIAVLAPAILACACACGALGIGVHFLQGAQDAAKQVQGTNL